MLYFNATNLRQNKKERINKLKIQYIVYNNIIHGYFWYNRGLVGKFEKQTKILCGL